MLPETGQYIPDLTLLLVVSWALLLEWRSALILAFFTGLAIDLIGPSLYPIGYNALIFCIIVMPLALLKQEVSRALLRSVLITFGVAFEYRILMLLAGRVVGYNTLQFQNITRGVLPLVFIDAALMLLVFVIVRALSEIWATRN